MILGLRKSNPAGVALHLICAIAAAITVFGFGPLSVVLGAAAGLVVFEVRTRAALRRAKIIAEEEFAESLEELAEAVRAKGSLRLGIEEVARTGPRSIAPAFERASYLLAHGFSLDRALAGLFSLQDLPGATALEMALRTHIRAGGNLSAALEILAGSLRQRISVRRELEALTAQARLSSLVLATAPAGFALLSYALGLGGRFLISSSAGNVVLAGGLALELLGYWWVRRVCATKW